MICKRCAKAADAISAGVVTEQEATQEHSRCQGCDCAHNVASQVAGKSVIPQPTKLSVDSG